MNLIHEFLHMIDHGDAGGTLLLALVMLYLGAVADRQRPFAYRVGAYAALLISVFYVLYEVSAYGQMEPGSILGIVWRTLEVAAIAYGFAALAVAVITALIKSPAETISRWIDRRVSSVRNLFRNRSRLREEQDRARTAAERERALAPAREQQRYIAEEAARRYRELEQVRDRLRYDLSLEFKRIRRIDPEILTVDEFRAQLEHALAPIDQTEIDRRVAALREVFTAVQSKAPKTHTFESLAQEFVDRHADIDRSAFPDEIKDKFHRWINLQGEHEIEHLRRRQSQ